MALGSGSYDTVGENILPGTYVSLSEDSGEEASNVAKREVIGVTVMNMKSSSKKYVYSTDYVNKVLDEMTESISTEEIKAAAETAVDAYIDTLNPATEESNGLMSSTYVIQLNQVINDVDALNGTTTITDAQYTAMMDEIFGGQLGSGGGSVGTTTTITDEQVTAGMNSIFGEGNWSE